MPMKKVLTFLKNEPMLWLSVLAALLSFLITPPSKDIFSRIDWHTLGTLFMMLIVLEGFKQENIFRPIIRLTSHFSSIAVLSLFLIFGVFFSSMFVTNDVSLIIFVPLTILLFRAGDKEKYILPVITMENIAAIRGSLLMPFGSPQNLFLYEQSGLSAIRFIEYMAPLCLVSGFLLIAFVAVLYRKNIRETITINNKEVAGVWEKKYRPRRIGYLVLFCIILWTIVSRTKLWPYAIIVVVVTVAILNFKLFLKVDYVLLVTFLCFFIFSSSITSNPTVSAFLEKSVSGREYWWTLGLSQIISNVPATIVLYPFSHSFTGLIYAADTAGLVSLIGSLASVINYRIYVREYPKNGKKFILTFTLISWAFFIIVVVPGYLLSKFWT
jgi:Na+/H+ antiporter NhaD/arsenite permease-like protein